MRLLRGPGALVHVKQIDSLVIAKPQIQIDNSRKNTFLLIVHDSCLCNSEIP